MANSRTEFPALDSRFEDEHGPISLELYEVARDLWPAAESFGTFALQDRGAASDLLFAAAAKVTERVATGPPIQNIKAYLFQTYKHLVGHEKARRLKRELPLSELQPSMVVDIVEDLERKILLRELFGRMDDVERTLAFYRMNGYTYEEIALRMDIPAQDLRTKFTNLRSRLGRKSDKST